MAAVDVIYPRFRPRDGGTGIIAAGDQGGTRTGSRSHITGSSPAGMPWGYGAAGPADRTRPLRITTAAGGVDCCPDCAGTSYTGWNMVARRDTPYDPARPGDFDPRTVGRCGCDGGRRSVPFQELKLAILGAWNDPGRAAQASVPERTGDDRFELGDQLGHGDPEPAAEAGTDE